MPAPKLLRLVAASAVAGLGYAGLPEAATNLRVEYMSAAVIDIQDPRFSWVPAHPDRGQVQTGYRVQVNATQAGGTGLPAGAEGGQGGQVVWDSGYVASRATAHVVYAGANLTSDATYVWSVMWWDAAGVAAPWSEPSTFTVALLSQADWTADWITCPAATGNYNQLRTQFDLTGVTVTAARLYITGLGYYRAFINGQRVGATELDPGWTTYPQRVYYTTYDVTTLLTPGGANVLAAYLGNGWPNILPNPFNGSSSAGVTQEDGGWEAWRLDGRAAALRDNAGAVRKLRAQLHIHTSDGNVQIITTNAGSFDEVPVDAQPAWLCGTGALQYDDVYNGCTWDARAETLGWDLPNYDTSGWLPAVLAADPGGATGRPSTMTSQNFPLVEIVEVLNPLSINEPDPGVYVFDFGQNFAGYCRLTLPAPLPAGINITLRHAEILMHPPYGPQDGNIYVANLRSAKATDVFITRQTDTGALVLEPMFTYHGFRYVELTGLPWEPTLDMLQGLHFRAAAVQTGNVVFPTSADTLNMLQHAIVWGQGSNLMGGIASDCPQRDERKGKSVSRNRWMGDSGLTQEEASLNFDMCAFYSYWALQMQDAQVATQYSHPIGAVPDTVPWTFGGDPGDFAWMTAFPSVVWTMWKFCGDTRIATNMYGNLQALLDYEYAQINASGIAKTPTSYGDWCPPPPNGTTGQGAKPPGSFISASAFMNDLNHVIDIAAALGKNGDVAQYQAAQEYLTHAYNSAFFNPSANNYGNANGDGLQTASSAALGLGLVPAGSRAAVAATLDADVSVTHGGHWSTGIFGMKFLHRALTENGYGVDAVSNLLIEDYPGFDWWFTNDLEPATTMLELPDMAFEGPSMNSRNHIMFGAVGAYLYDLVGIKQANDSVGWSHILLAPSVTNHPALPFASGSVSTIAGVVTMQWQNDSGLQCVNSASENTNATITCPGSGNTIQSVLFASFGTATGDCNSFTTSTCDAANSTTIISSLCLGRQTCTIPVSDTVFGDPCYGTVKHLDVLVSCARGGGTAVTATVPVNTVATVWLPFPAGAALSAITVTDVVYGASIFFNGTYMPGVPGVNGAYVVTGANVVAVEVGSGPYSLSLVA